MITLQQVHYETHDEVRNNDKVHYSFINISIYVLQFHGQRRALQLVINKLINC